MFEQFTDRARHVVVQAQYEARGLDYNYIGTEHFLLGLIRESDDVAAHVLVNLGADLNRGRNGVTATQLPVARSFQAHYQPGKRSLTIE